MAMMKVRLWMMERAKKKIRTERGARRRDRMRLRLWLEGMTFTLASSAGCKWEFG